MQLIIDLTVYPKQAVLKTCYALLGKGYFFLETLPRNRIAVSVTPRRGQKEESLKKEFLNTLLYHAVRIEVFREQKQVIEKVVQRALSSAVYAGKTSSALKRKSPAQEKVSAQKRPLPQSAHH